MSMTEQGLSPKRARYTHEERRSLCARAIKLRTARNTIAGCAEKLGVDFELLKQWLYHPQHEKLRAEAKEEMLPPPKPPSVEDALKAYDMGHPFDVAARAGRVTPDALIKALKARPRRTPHLVYR